MILSTLWLQDLGLVKRVLVKLVRCMSCGVWDWFEAAFVTVDLPTHLFSTVEDHALTCVLGELLTQKAVIREVSCERVRDWWICAS
ncbi:unnamed protein product, partial [Prorocentrum cordatum]